MSFTEIQTLPSLNQHFFKYSIALLFLLFTKKAEAQFNPISSSILLNQSVINPAEYGLENALEIVGTYRDQWNGLEGAPKVQRFNISTPIKFLGGGIGFGLQNFNTAAHANLSLKLGYAYHINLNKYSKLSLGLNIGANNASLDATKLITPDGDYAGGVVNHNDNFLSNNDLKGWSLNYDAGVSYSSYPLKVGVSIQNISNQKLSLSSSDRSLSTYAESRYRFYSSYIIALPLEFELKPFITVWSNLSTLQTNFQSLITYREKWSLLLGVRGYSKVSFDSFQVGGVFNLSENLSISYIFDNSLSQIKEITNESHEITIHYQLDMSSDAKTSIPKIYNPRYF